MPNLNQWAIWSVLLWSTLTHASQPTFEWTDPDTQEKLMCDKCPPGTSMAKPCTQDTSTECTPCADEQYAKDWNSEDKCLYCRFHCNEEVEEEVVPCSGKKNRVCECKPGYHNELFLCIKHFPCPPGSGVYESGNSRKDTKCKTCSQGTFSSSHSSQEYCKPEQSCTAQGLRVSVPGTRFHDVYCTSCKADKGSEEGSGTGDCYTAALDFVAFQVNTPEQIQGLYKNLTQNPPGMEKKKPIEELQVELHNYLLQLKKLHGDMRAWNMVKEALVNVNLEQILRKIQRKFSPPRR